MPAAPRMTEEEIDLVRKAGQAKPPSLSGDGFVWPVAHGMADVVVHEEHGRGLFIVEALTDDLEVRAAQGRTIVRCRKQGMLRHPPTSDDPGLSARFRAESHPGDTNRTAPRSASRNT